MVDLQKPKGHRRIDGTGLDKVNVQPWNLEAPSKKDADSASAQTVVLRNLTPSGQSAK